MQAMSEIQVTDAYSKQISDPNVKLKMHVFVVRIILLQTLSSDPVNNYSTLSN